MSGVTFVNCSNFDRLNVAHGEIVEEEQSEVIDCKGAKAVPLTCTIAVRPTESLEELIGDPAPPSGFLNSLVLGGVGLAIVPKETNSIVPQVRAEFVLDPMLPPEELPEGKAVVQRAVTPESSYGYKEKFGEWTIKHMGSKLRGKVILNPFWVTTWETKLIELPAFVTEAGPRWGVSSPVPPELAEAIYSPYTPCTGPIFASRLAELIARSHYWDRRLRARHLDELCWKFAGLEAPSFEPGSEARFAVIKNGQILYYVNSRLFLNSQDLIELEVDCPLACL